MHPGDPGGVRQGGGVVESGAIGGDDNAAGRRLGAGGAGSGFANRLSQTDLNHPGIRRVVDALAAAGLPGAGAVRVLAADVRTAAQAATALGVQVGAIANSLTCDADGVPVLALTSGAHRADLGRVAALVGSRTIRMGDPDFVRTHTGQPIGGVAPTGHPAPIRTFVDTALRPHPIVWAAAGHPKAVFPTTFGELLALTGGQEAELGVRQ